LTEEDRGDEVESTENYLPNTKRLPPKNPRTRGGLKEKRGGVLTKKGCQGETTPGPHYGRFQADDEKRPIIRRGFLRGIGSNKSRLNTTKRKG